MDERDLIGNEDDIEYGPDDINEIKALLSEIREELRQVKITLTTLEKGQRFQLDQDTSIFPERWNRSLAFAQKVVMELPDRHVSDMAGLIAAILKIT